MGKGWELRSGRDDQCKNCGREGKKWSPERKVEKYVEVGVGRDRRG